MSDNSQTTEVVVTSSQEKGEDNADDGSNGSSTRPPAQPTGVDDDTDGDTPETGPPDREPPQQDATATGGKLPVYRRTFLKLAGGSALLTGTQATESVSAASEQWTIVVLPDTQKYASSTSLLSYAQDQTDWIVNNLDSENIAFVSHEGDLVDDGANQTEWDRIDGVMDTLDGDLSADPDGLVPYAAPPGDHDYAVEEDRSSGTEYYGQYFGQSRYEGRSWFGGSGPNDRSHYQLFSAGGFDFLHIDLEWEAPGDAADPDTPLGWAQSVLDQYPNRPTIITTHSYVWDGDPPGRTTFVEENDGDGSSGEKIWQEIVRPNSQVFMVLNGNFHEGTGSDDGEYHQVSANAADLPVYEILANYQDYSNGGNGWLRLVQFVPDGGSNGQDRIQIRTYSPSLDQFATDSSSQFSFDLDFASRFPSSPATSAPAAPSDLSATASSDTEIDLAWTDNSDNEDEFEIERSSGSESFTRVATVGPNVTSYTDTGLAASTTYTYRVRAVNEAGPSEYSNEASATTQEDTSTGTVTVEDWERSSPLADYSVVSGSSTPYTVTTEQARNGSHSLRWDADDADGGTDYQLQAESGLPDTPQPGDTFRLYLYYDGSLDLPRRFSKIFFATQSQSYDPQSYAIKVSAEDGEVEVVEYSGAGEETFMPETSVSVPTNEFIELEYTWNDGGQHSLVVRDAAGTQLASLSGTPRIAHPAGGVGLEHKWVNPGGGGSHVYHDWFHIESRDGDTDVAVSTDSPTDVGETTATLNGTLNDLGGAESADVYFEYRQVGASNWSTTGPQTLTSIGSFSESLSGLSDGVDYEYRAVAEASDGDTDTGSPVTFTTSDNPPAVTTGAATDVGETTATLNGTLDDLGGAESADVYFEYRQVDASDWTATAKQTLSATGEFSESVSDLTSGTDYEFRAVAEASDGDAATGTTSSFTTSGTSDTGVDVTTDAATDVGETTATLNGTLNDLGGAESADVYFEYRQVDASDWTATARQTLSATGEFSESVSDLTSGTDYEFRAVAEASDGDTATGSTVSFTTTSGSGTGVVEDWERSSPLADYSVVSGSSTPYTVTTEQARNGSHSLRWDADDADGSTDYQLQAESGLPDTPQPGDTFRLYLYYDGSLDLPRRFSKIFFATQSQTYDPQSYAIKVSAEDGEVEVVEYSGAGEETFMPETSVSVPTNEFIELEYTWNDGGQHSLVVRDAAGTQLASLSGTPRVAHPAGGVGLEHKWVNGGSSGTRVYHDWFHIV